MFNNKEKYIYFYFYNVVSQPNSHQSVIENWSCESASSSTHFFRMESDDDNDGQTTDGNFIITMWLLLSLYHILS